MLTFWKHQPLSPGCLSLELHFPPNLQLVTCHCFCPATPYCKNVCTDPGITLRFWCTNGSSWYTTSRTFLFGKLSCTFFCVFCHFIVDNSLSSPSSPLSPIPSTLPPGPHGGGGGLHGSEAPGCMLILAHSRTGKNCCWSSWKSCALCGFPIGSAVCHTKKGQ